MLIYGDFTTDLLLVVVKIFTDSCSLLSMADQRYTFSRCLVGLRAVREHLHVFTPLHCASWSLGWPVCFLLGTEEAPLLTNCLCLWKALGRLALTGLASWSGSVRLQSHSTCGFLGLEREERVPEPEQAERSLKTRSHTSQHFPSEQGNMNVSPLSDKRPLFVTYFVVQKSLLFCRGYIPRCPVDAWNCG